MFLYLDYSRYIYYFSKPWGCYVCMCVCNESIRQYVTYMYTRIYVYMEIHVHSTLA